MKKITLLFLFVAATASFSFAQYIKIIKLGDPNIVNDSILICTGSSGPEMVASNIMVINADTGTTTLTCRRNVMYKVGNSHNAFCWGGFCYDTATNISALTQVVPPGDTVNSRNNPFSGDYYPNGHAGNTLIKYTVYDMKRSWDTASFYILYEATPTSTPQLSGGQINFSALYPNPASTNANFNYSLTNGVTSANLKIFNLLGECIQTMQLNGSKNKASINVQAVPSGVYICEIVASGCQPTYQKMIVSH